MYLQKYSFIINGFSILRGGFPINEKLTIAHLNSQFPPVFSGKAGDVKWKGDGISK